MTRSGCALRPGAGDAGVFSVRAPPTLMQCRLPAADWAGVVQQHYEDDDVRHAGVLDRPELGTSLTMSSSHPSLTTPKHDAPPEQNDIDAVGVLTEALETVERARGHLYSFHQLTGGADERLDDAVRLLREAGHHELADRVRTELIGRDVLPGMWTYQVVEAYDEGYYGVFRDLVRDARGQLVGGRRHLLEARLKARRQGGTNDSEG